jgi:pyruvate dehydrogenase E1 component alpha subunit
VTAIHDQQRLAIYRRAVTARRFEERVSLLATSGEVPAGLHLGAGHEVCQLAALAALRPDDPMLYGHRGTAYWLARDLPLDRVLCDIADREGGTNRGKGGVMHVVDLDRGILGESGTLGGNFVVGVGVAYAERHQGRDSVTIVFFGDGTSNRGQFHEALNFAAVADLPMIFFCENNGYGLSVPVASSTSVDDIAQRAAGYGIPGVVVDGRRADEVFDATSQAAERARAGGGPTLIEAKVDRIGGHWLGDHERYRGDEHRDAARSRDPILVLEADLRERGAIDDRRVAELWGEVDARIDEAVAVMRSSPLVDPATATQGLWAS